MIAYHLHEGQRCPGCNGRQWSIGRLLAECGRCGTALPIATNTASKPERTKARVAVTLAALALAGCDAASTSSDPRYAAKVSSGEVALAAEAPDGTKLWAVTPPGSSRRVYFSSGGAQTSHLVTCGKGCWRTVDDVVPASTPTIRAGR